MTFALVGTSVAADPVAKLNAKKVRKIAKQEITKAAPNLSVSKAKSADTAKTADTATSAANAINADNAVNANNVGGFRVAKFSVATIVNGSDVALASAGGLQLTYDCAGAGGNIGLTARTAADNARISASVVSTTLEADGSNETRFGIDDDLDTADLFDATPANIDDLEGQLTYHAANGTVVTAQYRTSQGGPEGCVADGTLTFG